MPKSFEKGFVPPIVILLLTIIGISAILVIKNLPNNQPPPTEDKAFKISSIQTKTTPTPTLTPTKSKSQTPTPTPTQKVSLSPTPTPTISNSSVNVISPNGGETWAVGETKRISWQANNVSYVRIYIEDPSISGSGSTNYIYGNTLPANQGYYDWTINQNQLPGGNTLPRNYKIRIDGVNEITAGANIIASDRSNNSFSIATPSSNAYSDFYISVDKTTVTATLSRANAYGGRIYGPGINVTSLNAYSIDVINQNPTTSGMGMEVFSGGLLPGQSTTIRTNATLDHPNGVYSGQAVIHYYDIHSTRFTGPSINYTITLTD